MSHRILKLCRELAVPVRQYAEGATILEQGKNAGVLVVLVDGAIEVSKQGVRITVTDDPGAVFGEISILLERPHTASVTALEACECHVIENPCAFLAAHPELNLELARLLAARLSGLTSYLVDLKRQFDHRDDHLGMVDQVLENLTFVQRGMD